MSERFIRGALARGLVQLGIADRTTFEMRPARPVADDSIYFATYNMPADRRPVTLGDTGYDEVTGVFQVTVNGPSGQGVRALEDEASAITGFFTAGKRFDNASQHISILRSYFGPVRPAGARATIAVSINWRAIVFRNALYNDTTESTYYLLDDEGNILTSDMDELLTWR